jgi:hypothetical protein
VRGNADRSTADRTVIRELRRNTDPLFRQAGLDLAMSGTSNAIHSLREFPRRSYKGAGRNRDRPAAG